MARNREAADDPGSAATAAVLRSVIDEIPAVSVLAFDAGLRILVARGGVHGERGYEARSMEGRHAAEVLGDRRWAEYEPAYRAALRGQRSRFDLRTPDGQQWFEVHVGPLRGPNGGIVGGVVVAHDVTDRIEHSEELRQILDSSPDAILRIGRDGLIEFVNATAHRLAGPDADGWLGRPHDRIVPPEVLDEWVPAVQKAMATARTVTLEVEGSDGGAGRAWWEIRLVPTVGADGRTSHLTALMRDVSTRKASEQELVQAATHDPLTGLVNRVEIVREAERSLAAGARSGRATAVLVLDLDRFKVVNDTLGHAVGDELLRAAGERVRATVRRNDVAGRLGGDEFAVVMRDLEDPRKAAVAAERLVGAFREPIEVHGHVLTATTSVGLSVAVSGSDAAAERLLIEADTALYAAKSAGRDRVAFFDDDLRAAITTRRRIEAELRQALGRGELELRYQPEIDLETRRIRAVEALLRWRHPTRGLESAEAFIEIAEESGLILDIGDWTIREACRQAAEWASVRPDDPPVVRVNLSATQLTQAGLVGVLGTALAESGITPAQLCVEIDQTSLRARPGVAAEALARIRALGVTVAVDAFGTGATPLASLLDWPIDVLKLDRSFVTSLVDDDGGHRLVAGILALAGELELPVTAMAVENESEAEALRRLGCRTAQGWLFAPAIEPGRITALLEAEGLP